LDLGPILDTDLCLRQSRVPQRLIRADRESKEIYIVLPQETISGGEANTPPIEILMATSGRDTEQ